MRPGARRPCRLAISLWALLPRVDLGYPAAVVAVLSLAATVRTHVLRGRNLATSATLFAVSLAVYLYELANGAVLIASPHRSGFVDGLASTAFTPFATGLSRSWQLIQPESEERPAKEG